MLWSVRRVDGKSWPVSYQHSRVIIPCPKCGSEDRKSWASERGWHVMRCRGCRTLYVCPRPADHLIDAAVLYGRHHAEGLDVRGKRQPARVRRYRRIFGAMFDWSAPVDCIDIGCGYGEVVEALSALAPTGSAVRGIEPMAHKAEAAQASGLDVANAYLTADLRADLVTLVDVFSHIPDFGAMLETIRAVLNPGGELFIETGALADCSRRSDYPGELGLPDHLVFTGEGQIRQWLESAGFEVVAVVKERTDGPVATAKTWGKWLLRRAPVKPRLPWTSPYRSLLIRARVH